MDGWNTSVSFWDGLFSGAMLVSGRVFAFVENTFFPGILGGMSPPEIH